jgi:hypothetical protein
LTVGSAAALSRNGYASVLSEPASRKQGLLLRNNECALTLVKTVRGDPNTINRGAVPEKFACAACRAAEATGSEATIVAPVIAFLHRATAGHASSLAEGGPS